MPRPPQIPFRKFAAAHVAAAKELMQGTGSQLRYACLELRLAIEALAYDTLQNYSEDESEAINLAHQDWQPDKVLNALCSYDPMADTSLQIVVREVGADGEPKPGNPKFAGTDERFSAKWAAKAHRSMGSFLHQRTISQVKGGKQIDWDILIGEATRVVERLDAILASPVHGTRSGLRFGYSCPACGGELSVAVLPLMFKGSARTTCVACGAEWNAATDKSSSMPSFTRRN